MKLSVTILRRYLVDTIGKTSMIWHSTRARAGAAWTAVRGHVTRKRLVTGVLMLSAMCLLALGGEAFIRARLTPAEARVPTTLYTRLDPWQPDGDAADPDDAGARPVAIGTVNGAALEWRIPVALNAVPANVVQAVLAVEDQRFYQHHGLDLRRIAGAFIADIRARGIAQGGSTITQQLAKNLFLSADRTPIRKLREAAMALMLEARYTKAQILQAYLNEIYLGQDGARAIHGVGAASRYYFGKDVGRLSLAESAQLAGMISAPNRDAATRHSDAARDRRDMVLALMAQQQRISPDAAARAERATITTTSHGGRALDARFFRDFVVDNLHAHLAGRGDAVYTTLDARLQQAAERAIGRVPVHGAQVALVAIDPRDGDVLAMVGGRDYSASQFNRATSAERQPGSAFKPIVALAALEPSRGKAPAFTLASSIEDEPLSVSTPSGPWTPADYDGDFRGPVTLREAMEQSLNVPFARVGLTVGPTRIVDDARRLGITSPLRAVPSIALGTSEVTLLELVRAYGVLSQSGRLASTRAVEATGVNGGRAVLDPSASPVQVVDSAVAFLVTSSLEGVVTRGTGRALDVDDHLGGIAGKTGTSSDWRDAWFIAYSPDIVVGVWVGFDDQRSLHMTGAGAALPVVASFLAQVTPDGGWPAFEQPAGVTEANVIGPDGASGDCDTREVFLDGTQPPDAECMPVDLPDWGAVQRWSRGLARDTHGLEQQARALITRLIQRELRVHASWQ
jgi:penicillin-binding protein 1B